MGKQDDYPNNYAEGRRDKAKMMEGVYGGPDYFANQRPPVISQPVYAGPEFFAQQSPQMFQTAYAGPDPQPNAGMGIGMARAPENADTKPRKWCHACGNTIDADAKFCSECGAPQPGSDA